MSVVIYSHHQEITVNRLARALIIQANMSYAVFRLERFTEVPEFTYLGKHFPCVNAN